MDYSRLNHETVAWATENARELLREESDRIQLLDTKAGQLAGFAGVVLALLGSLAKDAFARDLGTVGDPLFAVVYFGAAATLATAIMWIVFFALKPRRFIAIDAKELSMYFEDERLLSAEPWALQLRTLRALRDAVSFSQRGAAQKADRLSTGVVLFGVGLACTLMAVITLGVGSLG
jgi:hypothetical protein